MGHAARPIEFKSSLPDTTYRADGGGGLDKREHNDRPAHLVDRRAMEGEILPQTEEQTHSWAKAGSNAGLMKSHTNARRCDAIMGKTEW